MVDRQGEKAQGIGLEERAEEERIGVHSKRYRLLTIQQVIFVYSHNANHLHWPSFSGCLLSRGMQC
jgi:peroxiredoxin